MMSFVFTLDEEAAVELRTKIYDHLHALATGITVYDHDFPDQESTQWAQVVIAFEDPDETPDYSYDHVADPAEIMEAIDAEAEYHGQTVKFGLAFPEPRKNGNCLEGLRCPRCGNDESINIRAAVWVSVSDNGTNDDPERGDTEYDDTSPAYCPVPACNFEGTLGQFRFKKEEG